MRIHGLGWMSLTILTMVVTSYGATLPVRAKTTLAIPDISEWQGRLSAADVRQLKSKVAFVINRRQYGADYVDPDATNNTDLYVRYGIPFGEYDFSQFTGVKSARLEARDFYARSNKHARFYVLDFEIDTVKHGTTNAAVDAWVAQMRALTNKKLIFIRTLRLPRPMLIRRDNGLTPSGLRPIIHGAPQFRAHSGNIRIARGFLGL